MHFLFKKTLRGETQVLRYFSITEKPRVTRSNTPFPARMIGIQAVLDF